MNETVIFESPIVRPIVFEHEGKSEQIASWRIDLRLSNPALTKIDIIGEPHSYSSHFETLQNLIQKWAKLQICTTSSVSLTDRIHTDLLYAVSQAASVKAENASKNLSEIQAKTDLSRTRLADLLNINRRTLNNWTKGATISKKNRVHLAKTLEVIRCADKGSANLNSAALYVRQIQSDPSPFEAIRAGNYEYAKQRLFDGLLWPIRWPTSTGHAPRTGKFQVIVSYADADWTENFVPLPYEPEEADRKKVKDFSSHGVDSIVGDSIDALLDAQESRITGPIHFMIKLMESWELDRSDVVRLLGFEEQDSDYINEVLVGKQRIRGRDVRDRISHLLSIRMSLRMLFRDIRVENEWLREPQDMLNGQIPMSLLLEGSLDNIALVREYVDTITGM